MVVKVASNGVPGAVSQGRCALLSGLEVGEKPITMNALAVQAGVAATTITRLARNDDKAAAALSLDLESKIVTLLDCGIEDLLDVVEA